MHTAINSCRTIVSGGLGKKEEEEEKKK